MFFPVDQWFPAFAITCIAEGLVILPAFRGSGTGPGRLLVLLLIVNLATHQAVWFVFTQLLLIGTVEYVVAAELWAVTAESVFWWAALRGVAVSRVLAAVLVANLVSFGLGRVIQQLQPDLLGLPGY
jgi:hypothetical protein